MRKLYYTPFSKGPDPVWGILAIMLTLISFILVFSTLGCSKKQESIPEPQIKVTYQFTCDKIPYCVKIWDVTNINDFVDSSYTYTYSKTIKYNYSATLRCNIEGNTVSKKTIVITTPSAYNNCEDTLYPTLQCFIDL